MQCDQMERFLINIWPFTNIKKFPNNIKCTNIGSIFCQILKTPKIFLKKLRNFAISGHTVDHV